MRSNQRGQGMVEYILILALVVAGSVGLWVAFGDKVTGMLKSTNESLDKAEERQQRNRNLR